MSNFENQGGSPYLGASLKIKDGEVAHVPAGSYEFVKSISI